MNAFILKIRGGSIVQVISGNKNVGSLWTVEKQINEVVLVYQMKDGKIDDRTHFPYYDLAIVGFSAINNPYDYNYEAGKE